jgi:hypothetical protein
MGPIGPPITPQKSKGLEHIAAEAWILRPVLMFIYYVKNCPWLSVYKIKIRLSYLGLRRSGNLRPHGRDDSVISKKQR